MTELICDLDTLPSHYWLWFLPAEIADRRCCVWNAAIDVDVLMIVGDDTLYLTTFDGQDWIWNLLRSILTCYQGQEREKG